VTLLSLRLIGEECGLQSDPGRALESLTHHHLTGKRFCQGAPFVHECDLLAAKWPGRNDELGGIALAHGERQGCGTRGRGNVLQRLRLSAAKANGQGEGIPDLDEPPVARHRHLCRVGSVVGSARKVVSSSS
jgi:hypothetical protein